MDCKNLTSYKTSPTHHTSLSRARLDSIIQVFTPRHKVNVTYINIDAPKDEPQTYPSFTVVTSICLQQLEKCGLETGPTRSILAHTHF